MAIRIDARNRIDESEIEESFVRGSGPGGQNVNKVSTNVLLRFDLAKAAGLTAGTRERLVRLAGRRLTQDGVIVIQAGRHRTQERNRADALERLIELIREAATPPVPRRPTRPTLASKTRRLDAKRVKSGHKAMRRSPGGDE